MANLVLQAGATLRIMGSNGVSQAVTLPTGIVLNTSVMPRFAVFGKYVVMVNTPNRPITIDGAGVARVLTPRAPTMAVTLTGPNGGTLTGTFKAVQTYQILDDDGNIIAESDYGPEMITGVAIAAKKLSTTGVNLSSDDVTQSRLYRTTTGGAVYFQWIDVNGNLQTVADDSDMADSTLDDIAAPILGTAPDMTLIAEFRQRLWGVDRAAIDDLRYSEAGLMYAWPIDNSLPIPRVGSDNRGISGILARKEALAIGRRNILSQITGTSEDDFRVVKLSENCGIESHDTVAIYKDTAFWLWKDGVYRWDNEGIKNISDGKVRKWFTTNSYFDPTKFYQAFGAIDPQRQRYLLYLKDTNSAVWWVEYDMVDGTWWGPHKTAADTILSAIPYFSSGDVAGHAVGVNTGYVMTQDPNQAYDIIGSTKTGLTIDVRGKTFDEGAPDLDKVFGEVSVLGKEQPFGQLQIIPRVGYILGTSKSTRQSPITYDMRQGRQRLRRIGKAKTVQLQFYRDGTGATSGTTSSNLQPVEIYEYEIPTISIGRR